jgi:hypothetical protein
MQAQRFTDERLVGATDDDAAGPLAVGDSDRQPERRVTQIDVGETGPGDVAHVAPVAETKTDDETELATAGRGRLVAGETDQRRALRLAVGAGNRLVDDLG